MPVASKQKVIEYSKLGITPKEIIRQIREAGNLEQLTNVQIYNIRSYDKKKNLGDTVMNLTEFIEWCKKNQSIPNDDDEVFILKFTYKLNGSKVRYLRTIFTTKRLLRNCLQSNN